MLRTAKLLALVFLMLSVLATTGWASLALYFSASSGMVAAAGCALWGGAVAAGLWMRRWRWRAAAAHAVLMVIVIAWWGGIEPSNDRPWRTEEAVLASAEIDGDLVTVRNIRNFDYRTETDFTPAYYDKTFDVRKLASVDVIASYWMGPRIAHLMLSFGFEGGDYLSISIEARKERGEAYSTIRGFFKQYELYYVVADERDVIRVRSNYRNDPQEDVYVYSVNSHPDNARRLLYSYIERINKLHDRAEFYNTLTTNCTTDIWNNTLVNPDHMKLDLNILLSGFVPMALYEEGRLDTTLPFEELRRRSHINGRARAADQARDFSARIRQQP